MRLQHLRLESMHQQHLLQHLCLVSMHLQHLRLELMHLLHLPQRLHL